MASNPHTHGPYAKAARLRKAQKLAAHLHGFNITADQIGDIDTAQWRQLAKVVGVNFPSADTIKEVHTQLKELEKARALDTPEAFQKAQRAADAEDSMPAFDNDSTEDVKF